MKVARRPRRRRIRRAAVAGALVTLLALVCCGGGLASVFSDSSGGDKDLFLATTTGCGERGLVDPDGVLPGLAGYGEQQLRNAAVIIAVGAQAGVGPRGWVIAVATATQESGLADLPHLGARNDHDSVGLFQQRPSQGWGTAEQLQDPAYASRKFYDKLVTVPGWQRMPLTRAAQQVQRSAYPDAYAKYEPAATQLVNLLANGAARAPADSGLAQARAGTSRPILETQAPGPATGPATVESTAAGGTPQPRFALRCAVPGEVAASGWTVPVTGGAIISGFRTAERPGHDGVDLAAERYQPIFAAAAGQVITAACDGDPTEERCRRDGSPSTRGCGWYVKLLHAGDLVTMYCHMVDRPHVVEGQWVPAGATLGQVGTSGHSSGVHLHFEVHDPSRGGPVDPVAFMRDRGAPLGFVG
jgi:murein DD-endopeptidase MepM/ murein hydrolase activator NlpD